MQDYDPVLRSHCLLGVQEVTPEEVLCPELEIGELILRVGRSLGLRADALVDLFKQAHSAWPEEPDPGSGADGGVRPTAHPSISNSGH
jgi:hypothetical protein